jgi:hypothetical protein
VKTATRGKAAQQKTAKAKTKAPTIKLKELELGDKGAAILDTMAQHRQVRLAAEREEKVLKTQLAELIDETLGRPQKKREKLVVRAKGVIRGTRGWRTRKSTDLDLLLEAFPEAFEATVTENTFTQFDPA